MSIDHNTVKKIATLAKIRLTPEEVQSYGQELQQILKWIEQLQEAKIPNGVLPDPSMKAELQRRSDQVTDGGNTDKVLLNAPEKAYDFFCVPKVVE